MKHRRGSYLAARVELEALGGEEGVVLETASVSHSPTVVWAALTGVFPDALMPHQPLRAAIADWEAAGKGARRRLTRAVHGAGLRVRVYLERSTERLRGLQEAVDASMVAVGDWADVALEIDVERHRPDCSRPDRELCPCRAGGLRIPVRFRTLPVIATEPAMRLFALVFDLGFTSHQMRARLDQLVSLELLRGGGPECHRQLTRRRYGDRTIVSSRAVISLPT